MNKEDRSRVVHGEVFYQHRWMPIEKKMELEARDRKKIEEGFVKFQGEWITIEDKLARVVPQKQEPQQVHIQQTYNQQTYNIDRRVTHEHEHKHLHLDAETLAAYAKNRGNVLPSPGNIELDGGQVFHSLEGKSADQKMLGDNKSQGRFLEDKSEEESND